MTVQKLLTAQEVLIYQLLLKSAPTVGARLLPRCPSSCRASLVARDHRESKSVLTHSEEAQLSRYTQKLEEGDVRKKKKKKEMHKHVTSLDEAAQHHKAPECTEKSQRDRFVQNKVTFMHNSFLDLLKKKKKEGQNEFFFFLLFFLTTNDMYLSLICWYDPLQFLCKDGAPE